VVESIQQWQSEVHHITVPVESQGVIIGVKVFEARQCAIVVNSLYKINGIKFCTTKLLIHKFLSYEEPLLTSSLVHQLHDVQHVTTCGIITGHMA